MKKTKPLFSLVLLSVCVSISLCGCSSAMKLHYEKPPISDMNKGEIYVIVDDQRSAERGGDNPTRVGTIRNTFGMPFALKASSDREPSKVIKELVSDCLNSAGYKISGQPKDVPHLYVVLESFWSDGYQHSRIWTHIPVVLKKDEFSQPVWEHTFKSNIGVTWSAGYGPFNRGINGMLEEVKDKMIKEFNNQNFSKSLKSL